MRRRIFATGQWGWGILLGMGLSLMTAGAGDGTTTTGEVAELRRQVRYLSSALAPADGEVTGGGGTRVPESVRVADVNAELRMIVLGAGRRQGVAPGMVFAVLRDGRKVSRVRVVDVRPAVAGAVIEETVPGFFPSAGDRVLMEGQRE